MAKITKAPFEVDDHTIDEVVEWFVESRKEFAETEVEYLNDLIYALEFVKTHYIDKEEKATN